MTEKLKDRKERILFVLNLPPPVHGAAMMNNYLINSIVINNNFDINIINLQFARSLEELRKFTLRKLGKTLVYYFKILNRIICFKPALVYFAIPPSGFAFFRDSIYISLARMFGKKIVLHLHGKGMKEAVKDSVIKKCFYRRTFRKANVICLTPRLTGDIEGLCRSVPFVVPNGIPVQSKLNERILNRNNKVPRILYLSNFRRSKGLQVLIEALEILKSEGYEFNARLVGAEGDLTVQFLQDLIESKNLKDCIYVTGPLYNEAKDIEFENADIFVLPTLFDSFGLVNLEAMQYSLPVISTIEGGIPDIVIDGKTGFLVKPGNPGMLAGKIALLLNDKDLRTGMGEKGYERFNENYTLGHFENGICSVLQTILNQN